MMMRRRLNGPPRSFQAVMVLVVLVLLYGGGGGSSSSSSSYTRRRGGGSTVLIFAKAQGPSASEDAATTTTPEEAQQQPVDDDNNNVGVPPAPADDNTIAPPPAADADNTNVEENVLRYTGKYRTPEDCVTNNVPRLDTGENQYLASPSGRAFGTITLDISNSTDLDIDITTPLRLRIIEEEVQVFLRIVDKPPGSEMDDSKFKALVRGETYSLSNYTLSIIASDAAGRDANPNALSPAREDVEERSNTTIFITRSELSSIALSFDADAAGFYSVEVEFRDACLANVTATSNITIGCESVPVPVTQVAPFVAGAMQYPTARGAGPHIHAFKGSIALDYADDVHRLGWFPPYAMDASASYQEKANLTYIDPTTGNEVEYLSWASAKKWDEPFDRANGLIYKWSLVGMPIGSAAYEGNKSAVPPKPPLPFVHFWSPPGSPIPQVQNPNGATAYFTGDVVGRYTFEVEVSNACMTRREQVLVNFACNAMPKPAFVAKYGASLANSHSFQGFNDLCLPGVTIDAEERTVEPNNDPYYVEWSYRENPDGGTKGGAPLASNGVQLTALHIGPADVTPLRLSELSARRSVYFMPDVRGDYYFTLKVTDGCTEPTIDVPIKVEWSPQCTSLKSQMEMIVLIIALVPQLLVALYWLVQVRRVSMHPLGAHTIKDDVVRLQRYEKGIEQLRYAAITTDEGYRRRHAELRKVYKRMRRAWELGEHKVAEAAVSAAATTHKEKSNEGLQSSRSLWFGKNKRRKDADNEEDLANFDADGEDDDEGVRRRAELAAKQRAQSTASLEAHRKTHSTASEVRMMPLGTSVWRVLQLVGVIAEAMTLLPLAFQPNVRWSQQLTRWAPLVGLAASFNDDSRLGLSVVYMLFTCAVVFTWRSTVDRAPGILSFLGIAHVPSMLYRVAHSGDDESPSPAPSRAPSAKAGPVTEAYDGAYRIGAPPRKVVTKADPLARTGPSRGRRGSGVHSREMIQAARRARRAAAVRKFFANIGAMRARAIQSSKDAIKFVLFVCAELLYIPFVQNALEILTCSYLDERIPYPHMVMSEHTRCWHGVHNLYALCAFVTLVLLFPASLGLLLSGSASRINLTMREIPQFTVMRFVVKHTITVVTIVIGSSERSRVMPLGEYGVPKSFALDAATAATARYDTPPTVHSQQDLTHLGYLFSCALALFVVNHLVQPMRLRGAYCNNARAATYSALAVSSLLGAYGTYGSGAAATVDVPVDGNGFLMCAAACVICAVLAWNINALRAPMFTIPQDDTISLCRNSNGRVRATAILAVGADMYTWTPHDEKRHARGVSMARDVDGAELDITTWVTIMRTCLAGWRTSASLRARALAVVSSCASKHSGRLLIRLSEAIPCVKRMVKDDESMVRVKACEAIRALAKTAKGMKMLIAPDKLNYRQIAVRVTNEIAKRLIEMPLRKRVVASVGRALGLGEMLLEPRTFFDNVSTLQVLSECIYSDRDSSVRVAACFAIMEIAQSVIKYPINMNVIVQDDDEDLDSSDDDEGLEDDEGDVRLKVSKRYANTLESILGPPIGYPLIMGIVIAMGDDNNYLRTISTETMTLLMRLDSAGSAADLFQRLVFDPSPIVRRRALEAVCGILTNQVKKLEEKGMGTNEDDNKRNALRKKQEDDDEEEEHVSAALVSAVTDPDFIELCVNCLKDRDIGVRLLALEMARKVLDLAQLQIKAERNKVRELGEELMEFLLETDCVQLARNLSVSEGGGTEEENVRLAAMSLLGVLMEKYPERMIEIYDRDKRKIAERRRKLHSRMGRRRADAEQNLSPSKLRKAPLVRIKKIKDGYYSALSPRITTMLTKSVAPVEMFEKNRDYFVPPERAVERQEVVGWLLSDVGDKELRNFPGGEMAKPGYLAEKEMAKNMAGSPPPRRTVKLDM